MIFNLKDRYGEEIQVEAYEIAEAMITGFEEKYNGENDIKKFIEFFLNDCEEDNEEADKKFIEDFLNS